MQSRRSFLKNSSILGLALPVIDINALSYADEHFVYQSGFIKIGLDKSYLSLHHFSTDSLGKSLFHTNPLFPPGVSGRIKYLSKQTKNTISYYTDGKAEFPVWEFSFSEKEIVIRSRYHKGADAEDLLISFSQKANHCTALGYFAGDKQLGFPNVLHFPNMGSFRTYCSHPGVALHYHAELTGQPFVNVGFPAATEDTPDITYTLRSAAIYPDSLSVNNNSLYDGYKKGFINMFQLSPGFKLLANNSTSDACAFTVFLYAEMARKTPELVEGLKAFDLIRITLDRYINGFKGYGMVGKENWHSAYDSSDSFPSLVIAACYYILETGDTQWGSKNYDAICKWAHQMIETDKNQDGIIEYGYSGNADSWNGDTRPANWWDTIGFGHDDAYSNALVYRACVLLFQTGEKLKNKQSAQYFKSFAEKLKKNYHQRFYNPETGVLGGWRSADGKLHDYYFTFVNSIAIWYGLVDKKEGKKIMQSLLAKMKNVGYTNFSLGLPGNLIPIRREDYIDFDRRWGYGKDEEGRDGFQIYENGGATGCYAYYFIKALYMLDMKKEADGILYPMLESFKNGDFEGNCAGSTMTRDWKTWNGECWGYEGFLVDNYLTFLAVAE